MKSRISFTKKIECVGGSSGHCVSRQTAVHHERQGACSTECVCERERERERLCKTRNEKDKLIEQLSEIAPWNLLS